MILIKTIPSATDTSKVYHIQIDPVSNELTCDCPSFKYRFYCYHVHSVTDREIKEILNKPLTSK